MAKPTRKKPAKASRKSKPAKARPARKAEPQSPPMGSICYVEIPAPDLPKAAEFYKSLFGWTVSFEPGAPYAPFNDGLVGGGFDASAKPSTENGVNLVIKVADIPAKLDQIVAAGGQIVRPKFELGGGMGFVAYFRDPNGNLLCLWSRT